MRKGRRQSLVFSGILVPPRAGTPMLASQAARRGRRQMRKGNGSARAASSEKSDKSWGEKIARLMSREGLSRDKARDHLIMEGLKRGDTGALAAMLIDGHVPAPHVRLVLALMLLDNDEAEVVIAAHQVDPDLWWVPHRLVVKPRPARPRRTDARAQDKGAPIVHSTRLMPDVGYQAAIARLDEAVRAADAEGGSEPRAGKRTSSNGRRAPKKKKRK
jgi:hypothetical protein